MSISAHEPAPAVAGALPTPGKLSPARVMRAAFGEIFSRAEASTLSALAAGSLVALVRHAAGRPGFDVRASKTAAREAQAALAMRGLSAPDAELVMSALQMTGFIEFEDGAIVIPLLDAAARTEAAALTNRMSGWVKRAARAGGTPQRAPQEMKPPSPALNSQSQAEPVVAGPAAPVASSPDAALTAGSGSTASQPVKAQVPSEAPRPGGPASEHRTSGKAQRRTEGGVEYCLFAAADKKRDDEDPIVIRIPCQGDRVAEIAASYAADLQAAFRGVDVEDELRKCRLWCESNPRLRKTFSGFRRFVNSWMTTAQRDGQVRASVIRNGQARNGFGQGGSYTPAEVPSPADLPAGAAAPGDDFADLAAAPVSAVPFQYGTPPAERSTACAAPERDESEPPRAAGGDPQRGVPRSVLAARARLQQGGAAPLSR